MLAYNLEAEGFRTSARRDGDEALLMVAEEAPDVIVLDWMLPGVSGIEVCRRLKSRPETRDVPIIMLSARSEEVDRVRGLETGADDYVVKPYSVVELMARVKGQLRRSRPATVGQVLDFDDITLDAETHRVRRERPAQLKLGPTEFRLLSTFMEKPGRVWSREQLLDRVWGRDIYVDTPHRGRPCRPAAQGADRARPTAIRSAPCAAPATPWARAAGPRRRGGR